MNKLTLEHLAPYLPYNCKVRFEKDVEIPYKNQPLQKKGNIIKLDCFLLLIKNADFKLILRPLSDLTKEIEHNGERFVPAKEIMKIIGYDDNYINGSIYLENDAVWCESNLFENDFIFGYHSNTILNWICKKLISWHFDINNLIEKGLAININTIK